MPRSASAHAASQPARPPPTTVTRHDVTARRRANAPRFFPCGRLAAFGEQGHSLVERECLHVGALRQRGVEVAVLHVGTVLPFEELHRRLDPSGEHRARAAASRCRAGRAAAFGSASNSSARSSVTVSTSSPALSERNSASPFPLSCRMYGPKRPSPAFTGRLGLGMFAEQARQREQADRHLERHILGLDALGQ